MRKRMFFIPAGFILFILFFTVFGDRGLLHINHLKSEKEEIQKQLDELKTENERMKREIEALKTDRRYMESIARRDFGLVRPNEVVYQFPRGEAQEVQPTAARQSAPAAAPAPAPAPEKKSK